MGSSISKFQVEEIKEALKQFGEIVRYLKKFKKEVGLCADQRIKNAFKTLIHTTKELNQEEKDAVDQLRKCVVKVAEQNFPFQSQNS